MPKDRVAFLWYAGALFLGAVGVAGAVSGLARHWDAVCGLDIGLTGFAVAFTLEWAAVCMILRCRWRLERARPQRPVAQVTACCRKAYAVFTVSVIVLFSSTFLLTREGGGSIHVDRGARIDGAVCILFLAFTLAVAFAFAVAQCRCAAVCRERGIHDLWI